MWFPRRICFQPDKDVMIPGFPGIMDYPDDTPRRPLYDIPRRSQRAAEKISECTRIQHHAPYTDKGPAFSQLSPRRNSPKLFFSGAVQTKTHGPGLYEPSRLVLYSCWKNRSATHDFHIRQTESVLISVSSWEIEAPVDSAEVTRHASTCAVPEGKIGSYGHRSISSIMLGCVPVFTKERYSYPFFHQVINWSAISLHVPPDRMPQLADILSNADFEKLRRAAAPMRRRLLWTSLYGSCHLRGG